MQVLTALDYMLGLKRENDRIWDSGMCLGKFFEGKWKLNTAAKFKCMIEEGKKKK